VRATVCSRARNRKRHLAVALAADPGPATGGRDPRIGRPASLVFRNAAGKVLGTLTTIPGKSSLPAPLKPWW
jgi:hypothetical protein